MIRHDEEGSMTANTLVAAAAAMSRMKAHAGGAGKEMRSVCVWFDLQSLVRKSGNGSPRSGAEG